MISDSDLESLDRYIAAHCSSKTSRLNRLWAGRCAALLVEQQRLEEQVEILTREVDTVLEARVNSTSDTWVI